MEGEKVFKFTIRTAESKKEIVHQEVVFGSKEKPFPEDWKTNPWVSMAFSEHFKSMFEEFFKIEVEEVE